MGYKTTTFREEDVILELMDAAQTAEGINRTQLVRRAAISAVRDLMRADPAFAEVAQQIAQRELDKKVEALGIFFTPSIIEGLHLPGAEPQTTAEPEVHTQL